MKRTAVVYLAAAAFCALFGYVYTLLGYGESSPFMSFMFLCPLLLGAVPAAAAVLFGFGGGIDRIAFNAWNSGVALATAGCLFHGIVEISGRFSDYDAIYFALAALMLIIASLRGMFFAKRTAERGKMSRP